MRFIGEILQFAAVGVPVVAGVFAASVHNIVLLMASIALAVVLVYRVLRDDDLAAARRKEKI